MNILRTLLTVMLVSSIMSTARAQGEIPVDLFTGTPSIYIPVWTISDRDLSVPVGLSYNASGLKFQETAQFLGLGWNIAAGGRITRQVKGLPDDFNGVNLPDGTTSAYDDRRGWLHNRIGQSNKMAKEVGDFVSTADASATTCSDEIDDYVKLWSWKYTDTEPDIFYVNAPGLSTSFVFDNGTTPQIRFLTLQDLQIQPTYDADNDIFSFTVTNANGIKYYFTAISVEEVANKVVAGNLSALLQREYLLFNYSRESAYNGGNYADPVKFHKEWMLTKMESPSGAEIAFNYTPKEYVVTDPVIVGIRQTSSSNLDTKTLFTKETKTYHQILNSITSTSGQTIHFTYPPAFTAQNNLLMSIEVLDSRRADPLVKDFLITHKVDTDGYSRAFVEKIQERSRCEETPPYVFSYDGIDLATGVTGLPSMSSYKKDFWGYYNNKTNSNPFPTLYVYPTLEYPNKVRVDRITGQGLTEYILTGADRTVDITYAKRGTLNSIKYPTGGSATLTYESHAYRDATYALNYTGGGLRVKSIRYHDGSSASSDMVTDYSYEVSTGVSSGRLLSKPTFYIPTQKYINGATTITYETLAAGAADVMWAHLLCRTEDDMSNVETMNGSNVAYTTVTVKRTGTGSAKHVFNLPGTFNTTATGEWTPTIEKFARGSSCQSMGIMTGNSAWRFPMPENPNFFHERSLPLFVYEYNESGQLVRETENTYQYLYKTGTTSTKVWGIKSEQFPNAEQTGLTPVHIFGKYFLLTESTKVLSQQKVKLYRPDLTYVLTTEDYTYDTDHKYLSKVRSTNSDGTIYTTELKYPKDYPVVAGSPDMASQMIGYMQTNGLNTTPIEVIRKIQKPSQSEKVMGATLNVFSSFSTGKPLMHQSFKLSTLAPLDIYHSVNAPTGFKESDIVSGTTFTKDSRYELVSEVKAYDATSLTPVTVEDPIGRITASSILGYSKTIPIVQVVNATLPQVGFADFETTSDAAFTESAAIYGAGRTGNKSIHGSVKLTRSITKGTTTNYLLSFWAKTDATALTVNYTFKNTSQTVLSTGSVAVAATNGKFQYFEKKISVTSFPATFIIEIQGNVTGGPFTSSPTLVPVLDDVAFYPENSSLVSTTYEIPFGPTSTTDATGTTGFVEYDFLGRPKYTYDQDRNITGKTTYSFTTLVDKLTADFSLPPIQDQSHAYLLNQPFKVIAWEACHENVTYEWDFGNGFVTGTREMSHVFTSPAPSTIITLRVSKAGYTTVTVSKSISLSQPFGICAEGTSYYDPRDQSVLDTFGDCADIIGALPGNGSAKFQVVANVNNPVFTSYKWWWRHFGSDTWELIGDTDSQMTKLLKQSESGFEVQCEGISASGSHYSNVLKVVFITDII